MKLRVILIALLVVFLLPFFIVRADDSIDLSSNDPNYISQKIQELEQRLNLSKNATATNEKELNKLNTQLVSIKNTVVYLEGEIAKKEKEVKEGEQALVYQKKLLDQRAISYYKNIGKSSMGVMEILVTEDLTKSLQNFFYQKSLQDEDRRTITKIVLYIKNLEDKKNSLETENKRLTVIKQEVDRQSQFLAGEVSKSKKYEGELQKKIADLSVRQQSILAARSGTFSASIGDAEYDDYNASKEFSPGFSPAFAAFSVGAYTHRKGMSQYGARGRAEEGKNYSDILRYYYPDSGLETKDMPGNINVEGIGEIPFEDKYLWGIAEMPSNWHTDALKAQAVAARTYALYRIGWPGGNGLICTTQACQVYSSSKADNPPEAWKKAVQDTKGQVMLKDGKPIGAYYSSTTGGYILTSGWDTTDGGSGNFLETAYEKKSKSPWFYKAWYRESYSNASGSCGRSHPWLTEQEMADIINAWKVRKSGNSEEVNRILPTTITSCSISGSSGNPYSIDELAGVAEKYGGKVTSISSVSVVFSNGGSTSNISFSTNQGDINIPGSEFKEAFNLRAPGYISIRNVLFSIEKK